MVGGVLSMLELRQTVWFCGGRLMVVVVLAWRLGGYGGGDASVSTAGASPEVGCKGVMIVLRVLAMVGRLHRCQSTPSPFLELLPFFVGSFSVGLRRRLLSEGSLGRRRDAVQSQVLLLPNLARRPTGGGTEETWASFQ
uniref:Uncharacterized protein n=1 Tax=Oryza punctata TaxID=4537 RepID=A0A0E0KXG0_ORYPU